MTIYLKAFRSSQENREGKKLFYPKVVLKSTITLEIIAKKISSESERPFDETLDTCKRLLETTCKYLCESHPVKYADFGLFTPIVFSSGKGVEKKEDVSATQVHTTCFKFRSVLLGEVSTNNTMYNIPIQLAVIKDKETEDTSTVYLQSKE